MLLFNLFFFICKTLWFLLFILLLLPSYLPFIIITILESCSYVILETARNQFSWTISLKGISPTLINDIWWSFLKILTSNFILQFVRQRVHDIFSLIKIFLLILKINIFCIFALGIKRTWWRSLIFWCLWAWIWPHFRWSKW